MQESFIFLLTTAKTQLGSELIISMVDRMSPAGYYGAFEPTIVREIGNR